MSRATTAVRFNGSPLLLYQDLSQNRIDKIERSVVKATPLAVVQVYNLLCTKSGGLPRLVWTKENIRAFFSWL